MTPHERRAFPWYKEIPSNFLPVRAFQRLSMEERGLLMTLRFEYWVNGALSSSSEELDAIIHAEKGSCARLIPKIMGEYIVEVGGSLHFPDLQLQREQQAEASAGRSAGGRKGGKTSAGRRAFKRQPEVANANRGGQAYAQADYSPSHSSFKSESTSGFQEARNEVIQDDFVKGYVEEEGRFPLGAHHLKAA